MGKTLYEKVFERHTVATLPSGQHQLFMGLHLLHEVTSPQAFSSLDERGLKVAYPERTFATADHIIPTHTKLRPLQDALAEEMLGALEANVGKHGIRFFSPSRQEQGIVHVLGPELGLTQPGMTICCGDSHTSTHGAGKQLVKECSIAKFWTTDMAQEVIDTCLQFFGGYGYMLEYPVTRAFMDARVQRIYAGANEVMKQIIARSL